MTARIARHVLVTGAVQGVFFRDTLRRRAVGCGVTGWVRNRAEGSVEARLEGEPDAVAALVLWCRSGPPHASVDDLVVTNVEVAGFDAFRVR
ncbi:MAG TPA: acylphosphatase [Solirubrobacteraceae bacterium]|jgi:acylphosphatase